jgi:hypothetical protein
LTFGHYVITIKFIFDIRTLRGKMAKRITISIPDKLWEKIEQNNLQDELVGEYKISRVCRRAIEDVVDMAMSSKTYREAGKKDGREASKTLPNEIKEHISKVLNPKGPYKRWSLIAKVEDLETRFGKLEDHYLHEQMRPRWKKLFSGNEILDDWVKHKDKNVMKIRCSEMTWSYTFGCYEGISGAFNDDERK